MEALLKRSFLCNSFACDGDIITDCMVFKYLYCVVVLCMCVYIINMSHQNIVILIK